MFIAVAQAAEASTPAAEPGFFANPEVWVAITWLIVVALLVKFAGGTILKMLDARRDGIKAELEEAERLRDEAQELLNSIQKHQREAARDAEAIIARARTDAQRLAVQAAADLDALLARRERQALDRIAQAETDALREVRDEAVEIALAAAARLIRDGLAPAQAAALLDGQIAELPQRLN